MAAELAAEVVFAVGIEIGVVVAVAIEMETALAAVPALEAPAGSPKGLDEAAAWMTQERSGLLAQRNYLKH
jgi:hypothetical protein